MKDDQSTSRPQAQVSVQNIGGITDASITLEPGVTTIAGRNATNRTSLLHALNEALGGTKGSVRRGAAGGQARAELTIDDTVSYRTLTAEGESTFRGGSPYSENPTLVDTYATLVEHNPIRRLIESSDLAAVNDRLADLLMAPVDVDAIQAEIDERQQRLQEIDAELDAVEKAKAELPKLRDRREQTQDAVERLAEEITANRAEIADLDVARDEADAAEARLDELQAAQEECQAIQTQIERKEERLTARRDALADRREELTDVEEQLAQTEAPDEATIEEIAAKETRVSHVATQLDTLTEAARAIVDADGLTKLPDALQGDESVTAALNPTSKALACPLCGSDTERATIQTQIDTLRQQADEYHDTAAELEERQTALRAEQRELAELEERRDRLQTEIHRIEQEVAEDEARLDDLESELADKQDEVDRLRKEVEEIKNQRHEELERLYDEIAEQQRQRAEKEATLDRLDRQIDDHETTVAEENALRKEKADLAEEVSARRNRVVTLEERVCDVASEQMERLVDRLEYDRIEGIRIDRKPTDDPTELSTFELVVARREDGVVMEERDLQTLSASERSLVGLVVTLAGYITHDVAETVPFLLFDSIEQFDSERIDRLLDYVRDEVNVTYIVAALLPEDARDVSASDATVDEDALV